MDGASEEKVDSNHTSLRREDSLRINRTRQRATRQSLAEAKKAKISKPKIVEKESSVERKAPTPFAGNKLAQARKRKRIAIVGFVLLLGVVSSAMIGFIDEGQIDVQKTIEARNDRIRNNSANENDVLNSSIEIPVQDKNVNDKPDGGLVGRGVGANNTVPIPEPELASSTATSSLDVASSSEAVASSTNELDTENIEDSLDSPQETSITSETTI